MLNKAIAKISFLAICLLVHIPFAQAQTDSKTVEQDAWLAQARQVATELVAFIGGELKRAFEISGPLRAIMVCKYSVPEISSSLARRTGWRVTRVSLRPRNPTLGMADHWEQGVLEYFDRLVERGEAAENLEFQQVVKEQDGSYYRYMKALPTGGLCLSCHGLKSELSPAVIGQLASEYPHDRAVGYKVGDVRGAVSIKRPLNAD